MILTLKLYNIALIFYSSMTRLTCSLLVCLTGFAADTIRFDLPVPSATTGAWHVSHAFVEVPQDATRPVLLSVPQPVNPGILQTGSVSVSFDISEKGTPFNFQIDKSSDKQLEEAVIAMIREWRFEAALKNGIPVSARGFMDFNMGDKPHVLPIARRKM